MALQLLGSPTRRDQNSKRGHYGPLGAAIVGTYVAVCVTLLFGFALYMVLLMSPDLLQRMLKDVIKCEDFPGYLSPESSAADDVEYASYSPPGPAFPHGSEDNTLTTHPGPSETGVSNSTLEAVGTQFPEKKVRVFLGIFVMAWNIKLRHLLRMAYGVQSSKDVDVTIRFIMGTLEAEQAYYKEEVTKDNATFGDIIVLDCPESINDGKTFTFFSSLPDMMKAGALGKPYDYVMKADDDSYIRIANLGKHLKPLPRTDLYYGYSLPCGSDDPYQGWMAGAGYLISWDLVEWITQSPIPRNKTVGYEDKLVGHWFNEGGVAKNRATNLGLFYDHVEHTDDPNCARELTLDSILVHKLKTVEQWHEVLAFFLTDRSNAVP